ncbi:thermonuclease family protein [Novosphingobium sp.]|uniref:thermonuclease family protein n=1 Tax=Novosphingobium sp. TaxID=1874826 RepID=UPI0038B719C5
MSPFQLLAATTALCVSPVVHDGDTVRCGAERVRIAAIDAPEMRDSPRCRAPRRPNAWCDYAKGLASRDALLAILRRGPVRIERQGTDRYGRTLARLTVQGRDVGAELVRMGMARRWR